jgi:hypothetical protein
MSTVAQIKKKKNNDTSVVLVPNKECRNCPIAVEVPVWKVRVTRDASTFKDTTVEAE